MGKSQIDISDKTKELLSDYKNRIKLDDFVTEQLKKFIDLTSLEKFPVQGSNELKDDFLGRLQEYEQIAKDLQQIVILLARWGEGEQLDILEKIFSRIGEADKGSAGKTLLIYFGWYPVLLFMYSAGIAALSAKNYKALKVILTTIIKPSSTERERVSIIIPTITNISDIHDAFKWIPGREKDHVPRSEHLLEVLVNPIQKLLFIGEDYERLFDDFEVYLCLVFADLADKEWGPAGRFGWKIDRDTKGDNPFNRIIEEIGEKKEKSPAFRVGMFKCSPEKLLEVSKILRQRFDNFTW